MLVSMMANGFSLYPNKNKLNTWWSSRPMVLEQLRKENSSVRIGSRSRGNYCFGIGSLALMVLAKHNRQWPAENVHSDPSNFIEYHRLVHHIFLPAKASALSLLPSYDLNETLNRRWVQHNSDRGAERLRREVTSKLCPHDARVA